MGALAHKSAVCLCQRKTPSTNAAAGANRSSIVAARPLTIALLL